MRFAAFFLLVTWAQAALVADVRRALAEKDWARAQALIETYRRQNGITPEMLEAYSWLGRAALAEKRYDDAERYAQDTKKRVLVLLPSKPLNEDKNLPIALGAAIEVQAHVLAARGERDQAVDYLKRELSTYRENSILATRTQKNLHLLSLEGKPAPELDVSDSLSGKAASLERLKGKPVLLFLWAHWCPDCKQQAAVLTRLREEYGSKGLVILAPTQLYGYAQRGRDVGPDEERKHISSVFEQHYSGLAGIAVPVSESNFRNYGVSTTPTLVLVDRKGIVTLYHPGKMTYEELQPKVAALF